MTQSPEPSSEERAADDRSAFPAAGESHDAGPDERQQALEEMPEGNASVHDQVDDDPVDSDADA